MALKLGLKLTLQTEEVKMRQVRHAFSEDLNSKISAAQEFPQLQAA